MRREEEATLCLMSSDLPLGTFATVKLLNSHHYFRTEVGDARFMQIFAGARLGDGGGDSLDFSYVKAPSYSFLKDRLVFNQLKGSDGLAIWIILGP